jgi:hypothetical protein
MPNQVHNAASMWSMEGARVLILEGEFAGEQGICLGPAETSGKFAITPDRSDTILTLEFESEFGLLLDLSSDPSRN